MRHHKTQMSLVWQFQLKLVLKNQGTMQAYTYHSFANVPLITKFSHTNKPWATQVSLKRHHAHKIRAARRNSTQRPHARPYLHGVNFFKQPLGSSLIFQQCIFSAPVKRQLSPRKTWVLETCHKQYFKFLRKSTWQASILYCCFQAPVTYTCCHCVGNGTRHTQSWNHFTGW